LYLLFYYNLGGKHRAAFIAAREELQAIPSDVVFICFFFLLATFSPRFMISPLLSLSLLYCTFFYHNLGGKHRGVHCRRVRTLGGRNKQARVHLKKGYCSLFLFLLTLCFAFFLSCFLSSYCLMAANLFSSVFSSLFPLSSFVPDFKWDIFQFTSSSLFLQWQCLLCAKQYWLLYNDINNNNKDFSVFFSVTMHRHPWQTSTRRSN